jgi:hypothetical protein
MNSALVRALNEVPKTQFRRSLLGKVAQTLPLTVGYHSCRKCAIMGGAVGAK